MVAIGAPGRRIRRAGIWTRPPPPTTASTKPAKSEAVARRRIRVIAWSVCFRVKRYFAAPMARINFWRLFGAGHVLGSGRTDYSFASVRAMQITAMVGSHCDDTHTAFRTEPALTRDVLDCAITHFFPSGWGDMFSTNNGLLIVARVGIPASAVQDYVRYLTSAEQKVCRQRAAEGKGPDLQSRADESGLPLE